MPYTHTLTIGVTASGVNVSGAYTAEADNKNSFDFSLAASATDSELDVAFDKDRLKGILVKSDQNLVIETNSTAEPGNTLNIAAGKPFPWIDGFPYANPFTADVTKFYLTNQSSTSSARVQIEVLYDPTP